MDEPGAAFNIGDLAKPATALIEKVSAAVGTVFEPCQIRRIAHANADAAIIAAKADIEVTAIHRRAMIRFVQEEGRKQENIESITSKAIPHLSDSSQPEGMADDWVANFFDKCRLISDEKMQELWGKVLAGEANAPGTFSKRTVSLVQSLDKQDALSFTRLCTYLFSVLDEVEPIIYDVHNSEASSWLHHLDTMGLIWFEPLSGFHTPDAPKQVTSFYYGTPVLLEFEQENNNSLTLGHVLLTQAGQQLAPVCGAKPDQAIFKSVLEQWVKLGIKVASPWPRTE